MLVQKIFDVEQGDGFNRNSNLITAICVLVCHPTLLPLPFDEE